MRELRFFPLILVAVWLPSLATLVLYEAGAGDAPGVGRSLLRAAVFASAVVNLQGLLNAFAYGFTTHHRALIGAALARACGRRKEEVEALCTAGEEPTGGGDPLWGDSLSSMGGASSARAMSYDP